MTKRMSSIIISLFILVGMMFNGINVKANENASIEWQGPGNELVLHINKTYQIDSIKVTLQGYIGDADSMTEPISIDFSKAPFDSCKNNPRDEGAKYAFSIKWKIENTSVLESLFGDGKLNPQRSIIVRVYSGDITDTSKLDERQWNPKTATIEWDGPDHSLNIGVSVGKFDRSSLRINVSGKKALDNSDLSKDITKDTSVMKNYIPNDSTGAVDGFVNFDIPWFDNSTSVLESWFNGDNGFKTTEHVTFTVFQGNEQLESFIWVPGSSPKSCTLNYNRGVFTIGCEDNFTADQNVTLELSDNRLINMRWSTTLTADEKGFTFTMPDLFRAERGIHISKDTQIIGMNVEGQEYSFSKIFTFNMEVNKVAPALDVNYVDKTGIVFTCADTSTEASAACATYFQFVVDNQLSNEATSHKFDQAGQWKSANAGVMLTTYDPEDMTATGPERWFPYINGTLADLEYDEENNRMIVPEASIANYPMEISRDTEWYVSVHAPMTANQSMGYEHNNLSTKIKVNYRKENELTLTNMAFVYDDSNDPTAITGFNLTVSANSIGALQSLKTIQFKNKALPEPSNESTAIIKTNELPASSFIDNNDGTFTVCVPVTQFGAGFGNVGKGTITVTPSFNNYDVLAEDTVKNVNLSCNQFKVWPMSGVLRVVGEGFSIKFNTSSASDLQKIDEILAFTNDYPYTLTKCLTLNGIGNETQFHLGKNKNYYQFLNKGNGELFIKTTYSAIKNDWPIKENDSFTFQLYDPIYSTVINQNQSGITLTPMILLEEAQKGKSHTQKELDDLDKSTADVENITIVANGKDTSTMGVNVYGETAAAIASNKAGEADPTDLNYLGDTPATVTVTTNVSVPDPNGEEAKAIEAIEDFQKTNGLQNTEYKFTVKIVKNSDVTRQTYPNGYEVTELPYEASLEFDVPATAPAGYHFVLLREHIGADGKPAVEQIPWKQGSNGRGQAFTKKFSTFAVAIEKDLPKKDSSSGSSSVKKADNVVTCQMAGFPASYAWNESAKACQPGYIDNNGVFHLTAGNTNKRVGVVNTSDKGIGGMIASLAASTVMAIMASYLLKKYR